MIFGGTFFTSITDNQIGDFGMSPLARALMENTTLNALNLESDSKTQETHVIDLCSLTTLFHLTNR